MSDSNIASEVSLSKLPANTHELIEALLQSSPASDLSSPKGDEELMLVCILAIIISLSGATKVPDCVLETPITPSRFPGLFSARVPVGVAFPEQQNLPSVLNTNIGSALVDFFHGTHLSHLERKGAGAFGSAHSFYDNDTGRNVCIKKVKLDGSATHLQYIKNELRILRLVNHTNAIRVDDSYMQLIDSSLHGSIYFVTQHMDRSLETLPEVMSAHTRMYFMFQLLSALAYLHGRRIRHMDVKPANILYNVSDLSLRICDYGLCEEFQDRFFEVGDYNSPAVHYTYTGTLPYLAPENLMNSPALGGETDVFAAGLVFLGFMQPLHFDADWRIVLEDRFNMFATPADVLGLWSYVRDRHMEDFVSGLGQPRNLFNDATFFEALPAAVVRPTSEEIDVIQRMLQFNYENRPSADELLESPFFSAFAVPRRAVATPIMLDFDSYHDVEGPERYQLLLKEVRAEIDLVIADNLRVIELVESDLGSISDVQERDADDDLGSLEIFMSHPEPLQSFSDRLMPLPQESSAQPEQLQYKCESMDTKACSLDTPASRSFEEVSPF